jgi:hypothetical protein
VAPKVKVAFKVAAVRVADVIADESPQLFEPGQRKLIDQLAGDVLDPVASRHDVPVAPSCLALRC